MDLATFFRVVSFGFDYPILSIFSGFSYQVLSYQAQFRIGRD
jgi:hypothetical protein